jgi:folylpolyglutamate synthase/dihydropteroate synthase
MHSDKDATIFLERLCGESAARPDQVVCYPVGGPRSFTAEDLAGFATAAGLCARTADGFDAAFALAREVAGGGTLLCTGTLYTLARARGLFLGEPAPC